jgi:hypothetical protein
MLNSFSSSSSRPSSPYSYHSSFACPLFVLNLFSSSSRPSSFSYSSLILALQSYLIVLVLSPSFLVSSSPLLHILLPLLPRRLCYPPPVTLPLLIHSQTATEARIPFTNFFTLLILHPVQSVILNSVCSLTKCVGI